MLVVPNDVSILLSAGLVIVLNPVPDVPAVPEEPLEPVVPDEPEDPLEPDVPEVPLCYQKSFLISTSNS